MYKKTSQDLVSVIVLTWNRKEDTLFTIGKIKESTHAEREIIVVDNASGDGTDLAVAQAHPDVRYLRLGKNIGIGGYNHGLEIASGEFVVFLDSDSYPDRYAIGKMIEAFRAHPEMGVVAFDVRNAELEDTRRCPDAPEHGPPVGTDVGSYNGAGVGIRRECLERAGDLFAPLFLYFNEYDHSFRIWESGYRIKHFPSIVAYHKSSPSGRTSTRAPYFYARNMLWILWRYYPLRHLLPALFYFFYYAVLFSLCQKTPIYLKASLDALSQFPLIWKHRQTVSPKTLEITRLPLKWAFMSYG